VEYRRLGRSGLVVSSLGLGTNNLGSKLDAGAARAVLERAVDLGVTFIDTADTYSKGVSETFIGSALKPHRADMVYATKFSSPMGDQPWQRGTGRRWIHQAIEGSLRRLQTDWIDLYQVHFPDPATPIEETLRALDDLVRAGKVRYVGLSNFASWQLLDAAWTSRTEHLVQPIATQNELSLLRQHVARELVPAARATGMGIIPYHPLESGFLTGKYRPGERLESGRITGTPREKTMLTAANFERLERWTAFARDRGRSMLELAFGWLLGFPEMGPIIASASSPTQLEENAAACSWRLGADEMDALAALD
jgi:aryl-alcohol dehydrogenase-like predicted oxidoreductase